MNRGVYLPRPKIGRPRKNAKKLKPRQDRFIEHYLETGNATQAAVSAGYSEKSASVTGCKLLQNKAVSGVINEIRRDIAQELKENAHKAYDVLQDIMTNPECSFKVRATVASNLLDRAGYKATEKREVNSTVNSVSSSIALDLIQRTRAMMAKKEQLTIDVVADMVE